MKNYFVRLIVPILNLIFITSQSFGQINCTSGYAGNAFVDDLESQGLWTGDFGTGNGVWKVNTGTTSSLNTGPLVHIVG